jgi:hypothetical protein
MILLKTSQYSNKTPVDKLVRDWSGLQRQLGSVIITGPNANTSININGKTVSVRPMLEQAVNAIKLQLIQHGVKEIDTSPLPTGVQGLAVSNEPGKIHVDVDKIMSYFHTSAQPPVTQTDGVEVDDDSENHLTAMITRELLATIAHESFHSKQYSNEFNAWKKNPQNIAPNFQNATEQPAVNYENQIRNRYFNL